MGVKKILGLNAAKLYDLDPAAHAGKIAGDVFSQKVAA